MTEADVIRDAVITGTPWQDLRIGRRMYPRAGYALHRRELRLPDERRAVFGLAEDGRLGLFLECFEGEVAPEMAEMESLVLKPSSLPGWNALKVECICPELEDAFWRFCQSVITVMQADGGIAPQEAFERAFDEFRDLLRDRRREIRQTDISGLAGELLVLRALVQRTDLQDVAAWTGPLGAARDFTFPGLAIEVKTHLGSTSDTVTIASLQQLARGPEQLFLAFVQLDHGGDHRISDLVNDIRRLLPDGEREVFRARLAAAGFDADEAAAWDATVFSLRGIWFYEVADEFPRICPETIQAPSEAFGRVQYELMLPFLRRFEVSPDCLYRSVNEILHGRAE